VSDADVLVIGGGPAGTTAATMLKKYQPSRRIVLVERARFPRHHIGESTLPEMNAVLKRLGVLAKIDRAGFVRKVGVTYKWSRERPSFTDVFSRGILDALETDRSEHIPDYAWQIDRSKYDAILLDHAREHGVEVLEEANVDDLVRDGGAVRGAVVQGRTISTGHVVDASGQARIASRILGLTKQGHPLGDFAIYRYYENFAWDEELLGSVDASKIFFSATRAGWMWFIPLSSSVVSVGLVTTRKFMVGRDPSELFELELPTVTEIASMLRHARLTSAPGSCGEAPATHTIVDWSYSHDVPAAPGLYLAGDAAAFVDPILSSGVLLAHHSGLAVANAINTEWIQSDISAADLARGYGAFYRDLYAGFLAMARWWYDRRDVGVDDWLRLAAELGRGARGAGEETDTRAFMTFAGGFLTDYRFVHFGCGIGDRGIGGYIEGIEGRASDVQVIRELRDRGACYRRADAGVDVGAYLATDVASDRWWRLPEIRFRFADRERIYRPPVPLRDRESFAITATLRVIDRVLGACDGTHTVEDVIRSTRDAFEPARRPEVQQLANLVLSDLRILGVVA
jgi:flavin-dependent dehydrogenase